MSNDEPVIEYEIARFDTAFVGDTNDAVVILLLETANGTNVALRMSREVAGAVSEKLGEAIGHLAKRTAN